MFRLDIGFCICTTVVEEDLVGFFDCKLKLKGWVKDLMIGVFVKAVYWLSANAYKTSYWCLISLQTLAPVWVFP